MCVCVCIYFLPSACRSLSLCVFVFVDIVCICVCVCIKSNIIFTRLFIRILLDPARNNVTTFIEQSIEQISISFVQILFIELTFFSTKESIFFFNLKYVFSKKKKLMESDFQFFFLSFDKEHNKNICALAKTNYPFDL